MPAGRTWGWHLPQACHLAAQRNPVVDCITQAQLGPCTASKAQSGASVHQSHAQGLCNMSCSLRLTADALLCHIPPVSLPTPQPAAHKHSWGPQPQHKRRAACIRPTHRSPVPPELVLRSSPCGATPSPCSLRLTADIFICCVPFLQPSMVSTTWSMKTRQPRTMRQTGLYQAPAPQPSSHQTRQGVSSWLSA